MDIFNNREIAVGFWLLVISFYIFLSPKMADVRTSFKHLLSAFFVKQIISVLILMVLYIAFIVYFLYEIGLWNTGQIKNIAFWCVSFGFMSLFNVELIKKDKSFFKHSVIDNLKLLAILQFVIGVYTFSVWIEILLVPVLVLIGAMLAITENDERHHKVKMLLNYCISIFGIILIVYTLYMLMTNFSDFANENTAYDFFIPPLLTLLYLPFIFLISIYSTYEQVFVRLKFSIDNKLYRNLAKVYAFILFNIRISLLDRWSYHVTRMNIKSHTDLLESFRYVFKISRAEKDPIDIPENLNDAVRTHKACEKLEKMAEALSLSSLSLHLSEEMKSAISGCHPYSEKVDNKTIALIVEHWPDHDFNGFYLKFMISSD